MKAIMISIQPQWVEKILNGEKTIEIRKTMPKCELPCKVYVYCTKLKRKNEFITKSEKFGWIMGRECSFYNRAKEYDANGKVVAEFTLNKVDKVGLADTWSSYGAWLFNEERYLDNQEIEQILRDSCLTFDNMTDYLGYGDFETQQFANGYAWHIDNLKIYDKPKELSEFKRYCNLVHEKQNTQCFKQLCKNKDICNNELLTITRPPQSWCYVEELEKE